MTLTAYPSDTRPLGSKAIAIIARGVAITTGASSASAAIPDTSIGIPPNRIRLASTANCYARLGTPDEGSAVIAAAGTGYDVGDVITLAGGTFTDAMDLTVATAKLTSVALNALGSGYDIGQVLTLAGGTAATKATVTLATCQLASATLDAAGTGYAPGNVITTSATGGTASAHATLTVSTTKAVSATVAAGGAGDLGDGAGVIVEGTTGTGTKFRASVTITANAIASVQSISTAGAYTVNPTAIANEPVIYISGASSGTTLTGAQLSVVLGVDTFAVTIRGSYTVIGTALTQNGATTPAGGTGATFSTPLFAPLTWTYSEAGNYSVTTASFTQDGASAPAGGTGATFNTAVYGVRTVTVSNPGEYTVEPSNPVSQGSTDGAGINATFTVTWATAAAAGDMLITPGDSIIVDAIGFDHVAAIQVTGAGILQISPLEN
jgi:hypothetical protein